MSRPPLTLLTILAILFVFSSVCTAPSAGAPPQPPADAETFLFSNTEHCAQWMHLTPGSGNDFSEGVARMSAPRGRSFLLHTTPREADLAVKVQATARSGPALAWTCLRWKDANNFYEVVLKKSHIEVWRKDSGRYHPILPRLEVNLGPEDRPHTLTAQAVGPVPVISVWLDGSLLYSGADSTGLPPSTGRYVAIETEFSTVAVHSVTISTPVPDVPLTTAAASNVTYLDAFTDLYETLGRQYPCFQMKGIDWPAVGARLLPRAKEVQTDKDFGLLCMELVASLRDSHSYLAPGRISPPEVPFARWDPGFACLIGHDDLPVIYYVDPGGPAQTAGVSPGMTVVSIDGVDCLTVLKERMSQARKYGGYSSDRYLRYHAAQWLGRKMEEGSPSTLVVTDAAGAEHTFELTATLGVRYLPRLPVPIDGIADSGTVTWKMLDGDVGYIYVRRIRNDLVPRLDRAVADLKNAKGLIIDVRGNSGGGFDGSRACRNFDPGDPEEPSRPRLAAPIALLVDARCLSAGEGWASWFVANKRARLFGETTAGSSSAKTTYTLKNGLYKVVFSTRTRRGYLTRPIEYLGLVPDVPLHQKAADLAAGRDTVLEAARAYLIDVASQADE